MQFPVFEPITDLPINVILLFFYHLKQFYFPIRPFLQVFSCVFFLILSYVPLFFTPFPFFILNLLRDLFFSSYLGSHKFSYFTVEFTQKLNFNQLKAIARNRICVIYFELVIKIAEFPIILYGFVMTWV